MHIVPRLRARVCVDRAAAVDPAAVADRAPAVVQEEARAVAGLEAGEVELAGQVVEADRAVLGVRVAATPIRTARRTPVVLERTPSITHSSSTLGRLLPWVLVVSMGPVSQVTHFSACMTRAAPRSLGVMMSVAAVPK